MIENRDRATLLHFSAAWFIAIVFCLLSMRGIRTGSFEHRTEFGRSPASPCSSIGYGSFYVGRLYCRAMMFERNRKFSIVPPEGHWSGMTRDYRANHQRLVSCCETLKSKYGTILVFFRRTAFFGKQIISAITNSKINSNLFGWSLADINEVSLRGNECNVCRRGRAARPHGCCNAVLYECYPRTLDQLHLSDLSLQLSHRTVNPVVDVRGAVREAFGGSGIFIGSTNET